MARNMLLISDKLIPWFRVRVLESRDDGTHKIIGIIRYWHPGFWAFLWRRIDVKPAIFKPLGVIKFWLAVVKQGTR